MGLYLRLISSAIWLILSWTVTYVTVYGKTRHMGFSVKIEFNASMISSTIELTRVPSPRPIERSVMEIQHFVYDCATPSIIEKLRSKGVAMHAYGISAYYA